jgi:hypothetical protein
VVEAVAGVAAAAGELAVAVLRGFEPGRGGERALVRGRGAGEVAERLAGLGEIDLGAGVVGLAREVCGELPARLREVALAERQAAELAIDAVDLAVRRRVQRRARLIELPGLERDDAVQVLRVRIVGVRVRATVGTR